MNLTPETVFSLVRSEDDFPVDFEDAWKWLEYSRRNNALRALRGSSLEEGIDYCELNDEQTDNHNSFSPQELAAIRNKQLIFMSLDGFKLFCMEAGTPKGLEVRRYFLKCEKELKKLQHERNQSPPQRCHRLVGEMVSSDVVSPNPKFRDDFYEMLYRKYGNGWENRDPKNRPPCVGHWTNQVVYDRMLGGVDEISVKSELQKVNPRQDNGKRKHRHHHHLHPLGEAHLESHFAQLRIVDRLTPDNDWDKFQRAVQRAFPTDAPYQESLMDLLDNMKETLPFEN